MLSPSDITIPYYEQNWNANRSHHLNHYLTYFEKGSNVDKIYIKRGKVTHTHIHNSRERKVLKDFYAKLLFSTANHCMWNRKRHILNSYAMHPFYSLRGKKNLHFKFYRTKFLILSLFYEYRKLCNLCVKIRTNLLGIIGRLNRANIWEEKKMKQPLLFLDHRFKSRCNIILHCKNTWKSMQIFRNKSFVSRTLCKYFSPCIWLSSFISWDQHYCFISVILNCCLEIYTSNSNVRILCCSKHNNSRNIIALSVVYLLCSKDLAFWLVNKTIRVPF